MTRPVPDDDIRAMLEARAGELPPAASRDVLTAARATIDGPRATDGDAVVFRARPRPAPSSRPRVGWGIAAVVVAAVVSTAVLGTRMAERDTAAGSAPPSDGRPASVVPSPTAAAAGIAVPHIPAAELRSRLDAGELDGDIIISPGQLVGTSCADADQADPSTGGGCTRRMQVAGLDGLSFEIPADAGDRSGFMGSPNAVLRGMGTRFMLLGWIATGESPVSVAGLGGRIGSLTGGALAMVDGWVIGSRGGSCPAATLPQPECPGSNPWLTGAEPLPDGTPLYGAAGHDVIVDPSLGLGDAPDELAGPFLVREDEHRAWRGANFEVIARLDPKTTVWVDGTPFVRGEPEIAAADLMAGLQDGSLDGQVFAIDGELKTVAQECPLDARPCIRFYVDGLPGVAVTWDSGLLGSDGSPGVPISVTAGRLLVTPRNGHLELLGRLDGTLDRPALVTDLGADEFRAGNRDPLGLLAVDGWLIAKGPLYCPMLRPGVGDPCATGYSVLSPTAPDPSGALTSGANQPVVIHKGAPGIGPLPVSEPGPFLIREGVVGSTCNPTGDPAIDVACAGGPIRGWIVVARYDPSAVRVVAFP